MIQWTLFISIAPIHSLANLLARIDNWAHRFKFNFFSELINLAGDGYPLFLIVTDSERHSVEDYFEHIA